MRNLILDTSAIPVASYSVGDGQRDGVLLPLRTHFFDGKAEWLDTAGERHSITSFDDTDEVTERPALRSFVEKEAAEQILHTMLTDFLAQSQNYPNAKALVVTNRQERARYFAGLCENAGLRTEVAVSDDSESMENIERWELNPEVKVLVGVGQIHEGLNVPSATHIAYLTNVRTMPHATQVIGRVLRVDNGPGSPDPLTQVAHVYAANDKMLKRLLDKMKTDDNFACEKDVAELSEAGAADAAERVRAMSEALSSSVSGSSVYDFGSGKQLSVLQIAAKLASQGVPLSEDQVNALSAAAGSSADSADAAEPAPTPKQVQTELRASIERAVRRIAHEQGFEPQELNRALKQRFGKSRADMSVEQLKAQRSFLIERCHDWNLTWAELTK